MLINCPECNMQVSTTAMFCPHCGAVASSENKPVATKRRKSTKRMRLPNGFGQISELKNRNLRKPFRAMISIGKNENGRPICKLLKPEAYFETYKEAYEALLAYHKDPYTLDRAISLKDLFNKWMNDRLKPNSSYQTVNSTQNAWKYCHEIENMPFSEIRVRHLKGCIENATIIKDGKAQRPTATTKSNMKTLFNKLYDYAIEYELTDRNYARMFAISSETLKELHKAKNEHISYTDEELDRLASMANSNVTARFVLIQCYSGWRPQELLDMRLEDVNLDNWTFTGGLKTEAGKNRCVPIHDAIRVHIKRQHEQAMQVGSNTLFFTAAESEVCGLKYSVLSSELTKLIAALSLNPNHRPHDGRVCFVTRAKSFNVDEYAIKYMVGHTITDITESVYTKRNIEWLRDELRKIK